MSSSPSNAALPWLSLILVVLCVGANFALRAQSEAARQTIETSLGEAEAYHARYPDTRPGALLAAHMDAETHGRPIEGAERLTRRRQEKLDALLAPAEQALASLPERRFALRIDAPSGLALASYAFLHPADAPLLLTVFLLLVLGIHLEPSLGRGGYGLALVGGGLGAALAYLEVAPMDAAPLSGATGCLAGAVAAYTARHGRECTEGAHSIVLLIVLTAILGPALADGTWLLTTPLASVTPLAVEATGGILLGGLAGGVVGMWVARAAGLLPEASINPQTSDRDVRRALAARTAGRPREAYDVLCRVVKLRPDDTDAVVALWDVAGELGKRSRVEAVMLHAVREEMRRGELEVAVAHWLELADARVPNGAEAGLLVRLAVELQRMDRPGAAVAALTAALDRPGAHEPAFAARVARVAETVAPEISERAAWLALASPELAFGERAELETILEVVVEPVTEWARRHAVERSGQVSSSAANQLPKTLPPIEIELTERRAEVVSAVPVSLGPDEFILRIGRTERGVAYTRAQGIAVAAILDLGARPVVVVDLVLNWMSTSSETLGVVRLRSDEFDPRTIVEGETSPADALRVFVGHLLERGDAQPLPDESSALGRPFVTYATLEEYQRTVLMVESSSVDDEK